MEYTVRKVKVGDMRAVQALKTSEEDVPFLLAERCILVDGEPIGRERLDDLDVETFQELVEEMNAGNVS